jgi:hypothetical protein
MTDLSQVTHWESMATYIVHTLTWSKKNGAMVSRPRPTTIPQILHRSRATAQVHIHIPFSVASSAPCSQGSEL